MSKATSCLWILLATLLFAGCEEDVVAVLNAEYPYSLYGVLNPLSDEQYIRVFRVEDTLIPEDDGPLNATMRSVNLQTGEEHIWQDSLIAISDGTIGHVYHSSFRPEWNHPYRLELVGPDGGVTSVEVTVPPRSNLILDEPDTTSVVLLPASIEGEVPLLFNNELEVRVRYVVGFDPAGNAIFDFLRYIKPYDDEVRRTAEGWSLVVNMNEVYNEVAGEVMRDLRFVTQNGIGLQLLSFSATVGNEEWAPPGGEFNAEALIQPGAFSNVENGFGFVAAGYKLQRTWTLPIEVVRKTSFVANTN